MYRNPSMQSTTWSNSRKKIQIIISLNPEKAFDKIQHPFIFKSGIKGSYLNIVKAIYSKLIVNITINGEKFEAIPLKSGNRQGCPFSPYPFKIILEVLDRAIRQYKEVKEIQIRKEEVILSLFADMIVYLRDPNTPPEKIYSW